VGSSRRLLILVVATAGFAIWGGVQVFASSHVDRGSSPLAKASASQATGTETSTTLLKTFVNQSSDSEALPSGFQPIDGPTSISCAVPGVLHGGSCTLEVDQNVQLIGSTANNAWAICTQVDGVFIGQPVCPFLGFVPVASYAAGSFMQTATGISPGHHTVQTFLYTNAGATRSIYTIVYRLFVASAS
jgi:hypothetical protein